MNLIQFRVAVRTDAAGKYNPNAPLEGNEDNIFVDSDLAKDNLGEFTTDKVVNLSDKGCLMVVADGMGGMNAGEVASAMAIKTVMEYFTPERLTDTICKDSKSRTRYLETVVVAADSAIKKDSRNNPDHEGMGSTIILAWLCGDEICLTWCGDSRAYLYRPSLGFAQVSKDHSYVQGLVDDGKITEVEAFDHPYGNIITRSLGDPEKKAKPDSKCFKVEKDDVFMLCSDGLSGVLRDRKTYNENGERLDTDNIEDIIAEHRKSMADCMDCLFEAAQRNDWYDNVTVVLCEIVKSDSVIETAESVVDSDSTASINTSESEGSVGGDTTDSTLKKKLMLFALIAVLVVGMGVLLTIRLLKTAPSPTDNKDEVVLDVGSEPYQASPLEHLNEESQPTNEQPQSTIVQAEDYQTIVETPIQPKQKIVLEKKTEVDSDVSEVPEWIPKEDDAPSNEIQNAKETLNEVVEDPRKTDTENAVSTKPAVNQGISEATSGNNMNNRKKRLGEKEEEYYNNCTDKNITRSDRISNCIEYFKKCKGGLHWLEVNNIFINAYRSEMKVKINACLSESDVDEKKDQHDRLMAEIGMKESLVDQAVLKYVSDKKAELKGAASKHRALEKK